MKILIPTESIRINETSSGIVNSSLIQYLSGLGHLVKVIYDNSNISYPVNWFRNIELVPTNFNAYRKKWWQNIPKIRALPTYYYGKSLPEIHKINQWKYLIEKQINDFKPDIILVLGSGSEFLPHWAMTNIKTEIPWIANFHDPYPMSRYPEPYRKKPNFVYFLQERKTREIFGKATYLSFPSKLLMQWFDKFIPGFKDKSRVLPHLHYPFDNLPSSINDDKVSLPLGKFNIIHAGTLLGPRKVTGLFEAFSRLMNEDSDFKEKAQLTVIGKIARENKHIVDNALNNISIYPYRISYKRSLELLQQADLPLIIEADAKISPFLPGKFADIVYFEKPFLAITPEHSEIRRLMGNDYPLICTQNPEEIYQTLKSAWLMWKNDSFPKETIKKIKPYITEKSLMSFLESLRI